MYNIENFRKMAKILILVFLCSEMQSSVPLAFTEEPRPSHITDAQSNPEHVKFQASIRLAAQDGVFGEGHMCSGAVIAPSVVLTVAQCVYNYNSHQPRHPAELRVVMGATNRYQRNKHTLSYGVTHVHVPQTFEPHTLRDNIAIAMLARDIPATHTLVEPISWYHWDYTRLYAGDGGKLQGAGRSWTSAAAAQLVATSASKLSDRQCLANGAAGVFGAGLRRPNSTACSNDAGAPVLYDNHLVGLSNSGCATGPMVYTDVGIHAKWIMDTIGTGHHQNGSLWGTLGFLLFTVYTLKTTNFMKF